ncbi:hypothetical protein LXL04_016375 [Taraxacum kok-saghyz]
MAKLAILALAFTAIVAFAEVSAYTTTTITTVIEEEPTTGSRSQSQGQQCRRQIPSQQVSHCQMHITEGSSSFQDDQTIRMPVDPRQQQPHLQLCCQQLQNVEEECQCDAINQAFEEAQRRQQREQQQQGGRRGGQEQQGGRQMMQQMTRRAEQIPNQCKLQVQQCRIQGRWF